MRVVIIVAGVAALIAVGLALYLRRPLHGASEPPIGALAPRANPLGNPADSTPREHAYAPTGQIPAWQVKPPPPPVLFPPQIKEPVNPAKPLPMQNPNGVNGDRPPRPESTSP